MYNKFDNKKTNSNSDFKRNDNKSKPSSGQGKTEFKRNDNQPSRNTSEFKRYENQPARGGSDFKRNDDKPVQGKSEFKRNETHKGHSWSDLKRTGSKPGEGRTEFKRNDNKTAVKKTEFKRNDNKQEFGDRSFRKFDNQQNEKQSGDFNRSDRYEEKKTFVNNNDEDDIQDEFDDIKNELIIGRNPVIEALKAEKLIDTIFVNHENGGSIALICEMARDQGIVVKNVNDMKLSKMSNGASHQGVIAVGACAEYVSVEDIIEVAKNKNEAPFIIICDEIEDPHNLGAIIRTAEAAGAHGIIIPKRRSASLNHTVFKTSAGAASWLPVARVSNISATIDILKKSGIWIYGADSDGEDYSKSNLTGSIALIIGSEGNGIGRLIKDKCDFLLKLPMFGQITSLNASVAGGIFMYEIVRQRQNAK